MGSGRNVQKATITIKISLEHSLSSDELEAATNDAIHAAQRSLLGHQGADGGYVRDAALKTS